MASNLGFNGLLGTLTLGASLLAGCATHLPVQPHLALAAVTTAAQPASVPAQTSASAAPKLTLPPAAAAAEKLVLSGTVGLPKGVTGLANAHDGVVSGAPVVVTDVLTGSRIGSGVTYYDGSYAAEVAASVGRRPVLVQAMLVDAASKQTLFPLQAAVELTPELAEQHADLSPNSTVWVALLCQVAANKANKPGEDWAKITPGATAMALGSLIAGTSNDAQSSLQIYTAQSTDLANATSAAELRKAIDHVVANLVATSK